MAGNNITFVAPAPALDATRPAGLTYAVESRPGAFTFDARTDKVKTFGSLRRAYKALASLVDYEPKFTETARVVVVIAQ